jgi:hypothetical protein
VAVAVADSDSAAVPDPVSGIVSEAGGVPLTIRYATCADPETAPMANPATRPVVRRGCRAADAADVVAEPARVPTVRGTSPILMQLSFRRSSFVVSHRSACQTRTHHGTKCVPSEGVKTTGTASTGCPSLLSAAPTAARRLDLDRASSWNTDVADSPVVDMARGEVQPTAVHEALSSEAA